GSAAPAAPMSTTISVPETVARSAPSSNVPTSAFEPLFELQANARLITPPSPIHALHRRPTPCAAAATDAVRARSRPHSRVTLFIVCLRDLFTERGLGGYYAARASAD